MGVEVLAVRVDISRVGVGAVGHNPTGVTIPA
jgi:hypothetical protein